MLKSRSLTSLLVGAGLTVGIAGFSSHLFYPSIASAEDKVEQKDKEKDKELPYPNMHHALDSLKEAKDYLDKSSHNMRGHRVAAITHIDAAIKEIEDGLANPDNPNEKDKEKEPAPK